MKTMILGAAAALALWGCASNESTERTAQRQADPERTGEYYEPSTEKARESRAASDETVYDESATGGSGQHESVTTEEGTWDTQEEPMGDEPQVPPNAGGSGVEADSEVIDEGASQPQQ